MATLAGAERAMARRSHAKAAALFSQVIDSPRSSDLDPELLAGCYLNRGFMLRAMGNVREALGDAAKAAELNPASFKPHLNTALIYAQDLGRYDEALSEFDKAIELNPTCTEAYSSRGLTKMLSGDDEGATADFEAALSIEPDDADTLCNLGNLLAQHGEMQKAAETYRRALDSSPRDAEIRVNLAIALARMGLERSAEGVLREDGGAVRLWKARGGPPVKRRTSLSGGAIFLELALAAVALVVLLRLAGIL